MVVSCRAGHRRFSSAAPVMVRMPAMMKEEFMVQGRADVSGAGVGTANMAQVVLPRSLM